MVEPAGRQVRRPILVTGMPRSGTTWLARLFATAPGCALAGREPMNPRGRQYAVAHTLSGWARLEELTPKQARGLRWAYRGANPWVFSRYGRRQWAAPLPWTRVIVKDPFAVLSIPSVTQATHAQPVLVYRHPGAMLASYRRMGWVPDVDELQPILRRHRSQTGDSSDDVRDLPENGTVSDAEAMARFWAALYALCLHDIDHGKVSGVVVVSHEELATGGEGAGRALFDRLGITWTGGSTAEMSKGAGGAAVGGTTLHQFDRPPAQAATAWRDALHPGELEVVEQLTKSLMSRLDMGRHHLS